MKGCSLLKKLAIFVSAAIITISLLAACSKANPTEESSGSSSTSSSQSSRTSASSYTVSEAVQVNKEIQASEVELVQFAGTSAGSETVTIKTTMGDIEVILYRQYAPKAVENFVTHAQEGYYTGLSLDSVLKNFKVEGGAPNSTGGESIYKDNGVYFENEYSLNLWNFRGAVGMSNVAGQDKNGSQFYIVQAPFVDEDTIKMMNEAAYPAEVIKKYEEVGGVPGFDWKRTVFGMLTEESLDVLDAIARTPVDDNGSPLETILIESITVK